MGVARIRANLGAFRGDLSLFGDGAPSAQNEHSVRARSKRHFVALIQNIHKNGSTPQNEALKCTVFYKASPHNEDLALVVLKIKASK